MREGGNSAICLGTKCGLKPAAVTFYGPHTPPLHQSAGHGGTLSHDQTVDKARSFMAKTACMRLIHVIFFSLDDRISSTRKTAHGGLRLRSRNIVRELGTAKSHPNTLGNWNQIYCAYPQRSGHRGRRRSCATSPQRCCIILATASSTPRLKFSSESPTSHRVLKVGPQTTYWLDRSTHRLDRRTKQQLHRAPPVVREEPLGILCVVPSPALVQFLVEAGAAAAAAARHRPTVSCPHLILSWQGFIAIATSVADPPLPACPRIDPHAHVHDPSSSDVSKTAIGTLAREGVRPAPGCKASPPQALGPPRVLKRSSKSPKIARARRPAGRYSWPPERRAPPARSAAAVGLKYGHNGI